MKENIMILFCDVVGTYEFSKDKMHDDNVKKMTKVLDSLAAKLNCDKIIFSFISDEEGLYGEKLLAKELENLASLNQSNILTLGKQFYGNGYLDDNKVFERENNLKCKTIEQYVNELNNKYNIIKVIYADDADFYINLSKHFFDVDDFSFDYDLCKVESGLPDLIDKLEIIKNNISEKPVFIHK